MGAIAVIGAGGFVGTRLIESLVLDGRTGVRAVVRAYRSLAGLSRFGPAVKVEVADAEDAAALGAALRGCSFVVNVTTGAPARILATTQAIVEACRAASVKRLVHLSSAVVFGRVPSPTVADDSPPVRGHWMPYARAKAAAEGWLRGQAGRLPCEVAVLRPGIVWGVRSPHTLLAVQALLNRNAYLVDGGRGVFNGIYIDNLLAAVGACRAHPGDVTGFYNVADAEDVTWRDFYGALAPACGYDMARMPSVSGESFPWSTRALCEWVQALPVVNGLYHRLKKRLPEAMKARVKAALAGGYNYEPGASAYCGEPLVDRESWELQGVVHKLPTAKFADRFGFTPPFSFAEGVRKTIHWLELMGRTAPGGGVCVAEGVGR